MNRDYFFISKPRCASTHVFEGLTNWNDKINGNKPYYHVPAISLKNRLKENYTRRFSFGIVRNPYDLVISWYKEHRKERYEENIKSFYSISLDDWINKGCPTHWKHFPFNPLLQHKWLYDNNDNILVSSVIKLENYNNEIVVLYERLKKYLPENVSIESIKQTRKNETNENFILTSSQKEKIYNMFKKDFIIFHYNK